MNYTKENQNFVNQVVNDLLQIPNLQKEINPLLTKEMEEKFLSAGNRFKEIVSSFNSLPGVKAELYRGDGNRDAIIELDIPTDANFITNPKKGNIASMNVGLFRSVIDYYTSSQSNVSCGESEIYEEWENQFFKERTRVNGYRASKITIPELYIAVQKLIESFLKGLDKSIQH